MKRVKRTKLGSPGFFLGFKVNQSIYLVVMYIIQGGINICFFNLCKMVYQLQTHESNMLPLFYAKYILTSC